MILIVRQSLDQIHLLIRHLKVYVGNIEECNIENAKIDTKANQIFPRAKDYTNYEKED